MLRVVTFATPEFSNAASLLRHGAMHDLGAASFREYGPADVDAWLLSAGLSPGDRGHGWYAWKAHVIRRALADAADGDRVLWLDSTCLPETLAPGGLAPRAAVHLFALAGGPSTLRQVCESGAVGDIMSAALAQPWQPALRRNAPAALALMVALLAAGCADEQEAEEEKKRAAFKDEDAYDSEEERKKKKAEAANQPAPSCAPRTPGQPVAAATQPGVRR
jgi:hypothetical protein